MQQVWVAYNAQSVVTLRILADTTIPGVTISDTPDWHDLASMDDIVITLGLAKQWLLEHEGAA